MAPRSLPEWSLMTGSLAHANSACSTDTTKTYTGYTLREMCYTCVIQAKSYSPYICPSLK